MSHLYRILLCYGPNPKSHTHTCTKHSNLSGSRINVPKAVQDEMESGPSTECLPCYASQLRLKVDKWQDHSDAILAGFTEDEIKALEDCFIIHADCGLGGVLDRHGRAVAIVEAEYPHDSDVVACMLCQLVLDLLVSEELQPALPENMTRFEMPATVGRNQHPQQVSGSAFWGYVASFTWTVFGCLSFACFRTYR